MRNRSRATLLGAQTTLLALLAPAAGAVAGPARSAAPTTFTVNTTADTDLAQPTGTTCVTAARTCSVRAAVHAANDLGRPVRIELGGTTYVLGSGSALAVTNPGGTTIVGRGAAHTTIRGSGSGVLDVARAGNGDGGRLTVTGVTVTGGSAGRGAGLHVEEGSTAVLDQDVISGNTSAGNGGGIATDEYATLRLRQTQVTRNVAAYGGGLFVSFADTQLVDSAVSLNSTTVDDHGSGHTGGGIYQDSGVLEVRGGSIDGNRVGDGSHPGLGGGLYAVTGITTLTGTAIDHDQAEGGGQGGGVFADTDQLDVTGGSVSHDVASGDGAAGGGIYEYSDVQLGLHGVTMDADRIAGASPEGTGGSALFVNGAADGDQATIDGGTRITGGNAAAIYAEVDAFLIDLEIDDSVLSGNTDDAHNGADGSGCGGALCAETQRGGSIQLAMSHDRVTGNASVGNSGGGAVSVASRSGGHASLQLRSNVFAANRTGASGRGGALYLADDGGTGPSVLRMSANVFDHDRAGSTAPGGAGHGGAIAVADIASLSDVGSTFTHDQAIGDPASGGAVYANLRGAARLVRTRFVGNSAGSSGSGFGGAVASQNAVGVTFDQVTVSGNTAATGGGGVYADTGTTALRLRRSTVAGNVAGAVGESGFGGGIAAQNAVLTVENSTFTGNTARSGPGVPGTGGAISQAAGQLGLRYSTVAGNVAAQGGGIARYADSGTVLATIVAGNHATAGGHEADCFVGAEQLRAAPTAPRLSSAGQNVLGENGCVASVAAGDVVTTRPGLGRLANNGGPAPTLALTATSPAIGRAGSFCPATDERGQRRPATRCDAGAYQRAPGAVTRLSPAAGHAGTSITVHGSGFSFTRRVTVGRTAVRFHVLSDTALTIRAPKHRRGSVVVRVTTVDGHASTRSFRYRG